MSCPEHHGEVRDDGIWLTGSKARLEFINLLMLLCHACLNGGDLLAIFLLRIPESPKPLRLVVGMLADCLLELLLALGYLLFIG